MLLFPRDWQNEKKKRTEKREGNSNIHGNGTKSGFPFFPVPVLFPLKFDGNLGREKGILEKINKIIKNN